MYYIRTADKLMRTARWVEQMDGGIEVGPLELSIDVIPLKCASIAEAQTNTA